MKEKHSRAENNKVVRIQNVETIIGLIQRNDQSSTDLLVKKSGLSYPTVFGIVQELQKAGVVEQAGYANSTGGRQAHLYSICASYAYTFGVHITGDWIDLALTNLKGGIVYQHRIEYSEGAEQLPGLLVDAMEAALKLVRISKDKLLAACICMGPATRKYLGELGIRLCDIVQEHLGIPVESVADSAVQGFLDWETISCSEVESFLHVVFGESVQATLYQNSGEKIELAGSLSHVTVFPGGAKCSCGKYGCLETYYNGNELLRQYNEARTRAKLATLDRKTIQSKGLFRYLLSRSLAQEPHAGQMLEQATEALAIMLTNLMAIMNEYHVVLSGLYSSNDIRNFRKLREAVQKNLSEEEQAKLDLSMGLALPAESALGASKMMNNKYACQIGRYLENRKRGAER